MDIVTNTSLFATNLQVLASNLDRQLLKNGVVLDTVSHLEVSYFAPEDSASSFAQDTSDTTGQSKRRNGGKLAVNLLVRGHYNRDLNVDFDYVVQDSINRQTHAIRRQLYVLYVCVFVGVCRRMGICWEIKLGNACVLYDLKLIPAHTISLSLIQNILLLGQCSIKTVEIKQPRL